MVLTVGDRLAVAAADLCSRQAPDIGFSLHDLSQYGPAYRNAARAMFARPDLPAVLAVAGGGAAARAGVRPGDGVVAVNGQAVPPETGDGLARVETVIAAAVRAARAGPVRLSLVRDGAQITRTFTAPAGCAVRFQVEPNGALDARTNGWLIEATTGLIDFVRGPDELAAVLAHELGHVILNHRARIGRVSRGESRVEELEADRLGVRLADRAGYRPEAALEFWQRMRRKGGAGPSGLGRHPADSQRVATVEHALRDLARTRAVPAAR